MENTTALKLDDDDEYSDLNYKYIIDSHTTVLF